MNESLIQQVWQRAANRCEYCLLPSRFFPLNFHIDHITARQHRGSTELDNLALACLHCNRHKGPNLASLDPLDGELVRLFHPRQDLWESHFEWHGTELVEKSAIGRVTISVLAINAPDFRANRDALLLEGNFLT